MTEKGWDKDTTQEGFSSREKRAQAHALLVWQLASIQSLEWVLASRERERHSREAIIESVTQQSCREDKTTIQAKSESEVKNILG